MTFKSISFFSVAALSACLGLTACNAGDASTKADAAPANTDYIKTSKPGAKVQFSHTLGKAAAEGQALTLTVSEGYDSGTLTIKIIGNDNLSISGAGRSTQYAMSGDGAHVLNLSVKALAAGKHFVNFTAIAESAEGQVARASYAVPIYSGINPEKIGTAQAAQGDTSTHSGAIIVMDAEETIIPGKSE